MDVKVRQASIDDLDILVRYQLQMAKETENMKLDVEILTNGISQGLNDENKAIYFVAEIRDVVIGTLMITKEWSDWRNVWVLWIQSVYVDKDYRGRGVYKELYNHIKGIVSAENFGGIRLYVDKTNINAQNVYTKLGMNGDHYKLFENME
ncbi:MAG: GNAT family N-acetyltransferase [Bacteroidales bacterium]|nr:GNAT family N-acetyltransferase [Bacteroidales bacterium]